MDQADDQPVVGVGPWEGDWPTDPRYDRALLAGGDARNVVDRYRYWTREAIVEDLDRRRHPFHVAVENFTHDFNIGSVVRTANAFAAAQVHIVGRRRWNRRGAMVTDRYQHVRHHIDVGSLGGWADDEGLVRMLGEAEPRQAAPLSIEQNERRQIAEVLRAAEGNRSRAARMLGVSRATIYRKIKEYGL